MRPEQDAFLERLYREQFRRLELYAYRIVRSHSDAEAVVQDAFHTACRKIAELMDSPNPEGWMVLTVKNTAANLLKSRARHMALVVSLEDIGEDRVAAADAFRQVELLDQCRQAVTPEELAFYRKIVLEGLTYKEAAQAEGISLWACYKRVERIAAKLRAALEAEG